MTTAPKKWLTVAEAATIADVHSSLVYRWVEEKCFKRRRVGKTGCRGKIQICPRSFRAFLKKTERA